MKVSIVTPSFNQGKFIKRAIDSVRTQNAHFSIEHIVLDNCSTDCTSQILEEYAKNGGEIDVKVFIEADEGQTAAINKGFEIASGDIICWLNTDECYTPDAFSLVVAFFEAHPAIDVVFGDCVFVSAEGLFVKRKREYFFSYSMLLYYGCFIPSCATFVRRRALADVGLLDPKLKVAMDFEWYVRLADAGLKFAHLPRVLAAFTWHESNISSTFAKQGWAEVRSVQDRFGCLTGPVWLRRALYYVLRHFWIGVRIARRRIGWLSHFFRFDRYSRVRRAA